MGLKLSCIHRGSLSRQVHQPASPAPARVIAADGSLKELPASPFIAVSDVLGLIGGDAAASFFVCNSDALYFNEHPPALAPGKLLRPGQIYFVPPAAMLGRPLSTAAMAALAVRASSALESGNKTRRRRGRRSGGKNTVREDSAGDDVDFVNLKLNEQTLGELGLLLSPAKSDEKVVAAVATAAARSRLKHALSIIQEDAE